MHRMVKTLALGCLLGLSACGGSNEPLSYTVGGTVIGLAGGVLSIKSNGVVLAIGSNGAFTMPGSIKNGSPYQITVLQQPQVALNPLTQNCTVANGSGVSNGGNVTNVRIVCTNIARFAYVTSQDALRLGYVSGYAVDPINGALAPLPGSPYATGQYITQGLVVHPSGRFLYAVNIGNISGFAVDNSTGELSPLPGSPFGFAEFSISGWSLVIDPSGSFMYVTANNGNRVFAFTIDVATGELHELPPVPASGNQNGGPRTEAVESTGHYLYVADPGNSYVAAYAINSVSGALTPAAGSPFPTASGPTGIAADPAGNYLYTPSAGGGRLFAFGIDANSGALAELPAPSLPAPLQLPKSIVSDPRGRFVFVLAAALIPAPTAGDPDSLVNYILTYGIDPSSGALTAGAGSPFALAVNPAEASNLGIEPSGKFLYWTFLQEGELGVAPLDPVSGAVGGGIATATDLNAHVYTGFIAFLP
jgi:6-phosphogluconolactonase (cycloisomerase 2 family)